MTRRPSSDRAAAPRARRNASPALSEGDAAHEAQPFDALVPPEQQGLVEQLRHGTCRTPHDLLGAHPATIAGVPGVVIRAWMPQAQAVEVEWNGGTTPETVSQTAAMIAGPAGLFALFLPGQSVPMTYRFVVSGADGHRWPVDDPYRFLPTLGDVDLHLLGEGRHLRLWEVLGAHPRHLDGVAGVSFAVWAPTAQRVSVIGAFNAWDGRCHPMRLLGASGIFEVFIPGVSVGALYKFEIRGADGSVQVKTDPVAFKVEQAPGFAAIVEARGTYAWQDGAWMAERPASTPARSPMLVYEVHLGSWRRAPDGRVLSYREIAPLLADHVRQLGFTHVELLPILEHPFGGSWGYQVGAYYAPTSRYGTPDDFRWFVDTMHQAGIGVILDWVPAHFPKDAWALRRFDGTACYEHEDPRLGDHPEWGTHIFNYARHEVRNFLLANALYWIDEFHIDGLRVDAVASMLYLDYGRAPGQWLRNRHGGNENLEAVAFLKQLNHTVHMLHRGVLMIAEESTTWPKVTHPVEEGGLGFSFKWNMGWMHDTLKYFAVDPLYRSHHHDQLTFAMMYEYSERFMNPLSHDEVVHLKGSLLRKMPGDDWQRAANLRALLAYAMLRPGKSLFFMGFELGTWKEWDHDAPLDWPLLDHPLHRGVHRFVAAAGALYRERSCFWRRDHEPAGFGWINVADRAQSVLAFARYDGADHAVVIMNLTPVPRPAYRLGLPTAGRYRLRLNSDAHDFGGSGAATDEVVTTESIPFHGFLQSATLALPPLAVLVLEPESGSFPVPLTSSVS